MKSPLHNKFFVFGIARFVAIGLGFCLVNSFAFNDHPISTGIVYPSDNSALIENPGTLPQSQMMAEVLAGASPNKSSFSAEGTVVGNAAIFGYGFGLNHIDSGSVNALAGVGVGGDSLGGGLNLRYDLEQEQGGIDAGFYFGGTLLDLGFAARNIDDGIERLVFGLGFKNQTGVKLEADLEYDTDEGFTDIDPALSVDLGDFDLAVGYRIGLKSDASGEKFRFGANFWFDDQKSVEFLYNFRLAQYAGGVKIRL